MTAVRDAHSPFLKCESIKLLSALYKHDGTNAEELLSKKASSSTKECCSKVAETLQHALGDSSLQKPKHRDEVLVATKHFVNYLQAQDEGILTDAEIRAFQETLKTVKRNCKSTGMKQMCKAVYDKISVLARREIAEEPTPKRSKDSKVPKSSKKQKKSKK